MFAHPHYIAALPMQEVPCRCERPDPHEMWRRLQLVRALVDRAPADHPGAAQELADLITQALDGLVVPWSRPRVTGPELRRLRSAFATCHGRRELYAQVASGDAWCACCWEPAAEVPLVVDHIVPLAWGGTNARANLQLLCIPCNSRKGSGLYSYQLGVYEPVVE